METKAKEILYASEAKADAEKAQSENFEKAMVRIAQNAQLGLQEVALLGLGLNLEGVKKLMDLGYSVTTVLHPFEQVKIYKISW